VVAFIRALPVIYLAIGWLGGRTSALGTCGLWLCCMALSAAQVYRLSGDHLCLKCEELGLDPDGTVRELRSRLADHVKNCQMDQTGNQGVTQARVPSESVHNEVERGPPPLLLPAHMVAVIPPLLW
jgi:hypothetical protein